jgi:DNA processing protein
MTIVNNMGCPWFTGQNLPIQLDLTDQGYVPDCLQPKLKRVSLLGESSLLPQPIIGIVRSRHASRQGIGDSFWFAKELALAGCVVVSGLAVGIDAAAHRGAISAGLNKTIAFIAHGFQFCYPAGHQGLLQEIIQTSGAVISEHESNTPPTPHQFLHRNRIIAGLCDALLVIEAGPKSGALTTAGLALEFGKDIYAVPGSIHSELSHGGHQLLRQGAGLVESSQELLSDLGHRLLPLAKQTNLRKEPKEVSGQRTCQADFPELRDPRYDLINSALGYEPQTAMELLSKLPEQTSENDVIAGLLMLELNRNAFRLPDGRGVRFKNH